MLTSFDTTKDIQKLKWDSEDLIRLKDYAKYRDLYRSNFAMPFRNVINKLMQRYPLQVTTAQTLVEVNLFKTLTDFFKNLTANNEF